MKKFVVLASSLLFFVLFLCSSFFLDRRNIVYAVSCTGTITCGTWVQSQNACSGGVRDGLSCDPNALINDCPGGSCLTVAAHCDNTQTQTSSCYVTIPGNGEAPYCQLNAPCNNGTSNSCTISGQCTVVGNPPSCGAGQQFCAACNACMSTSLTCAQWQAQSCSGSGGGGGGNTCGGGSNPACYSAGNCGAVGKIPGSGSCPSGQLCCVDSGGALAYGVQRFYAYCQDGNGPQYPLPGVRIALTGSNNNPPPGTTTYAPVTTDANGRASYDSPLNPLSSFPSQNYTTSFTDLPWPWTTNQNPWSGTSMGGNVVPATGQLYANLTRGDTYNRLQTYPSIFENTYMPVSSPWVCDGAYTGGNCNGWYGGGWANPAGGWATNPAPTWYSFNLPSYGNGNYAASFHFSNCFPTCVTPGTPALIIPLANGTINTTNGQVTIQWGVAAGAGRYDLELYPYGTSCADPNAFCTYTASGGGIAGTSYTFSPVTSKYTFRVRGVATNCTGPGTGAWNGTDFTITTQISGTFYSDPLHTVTQDAFGVCQTGAGITTINAPAGTTVAGTWSTGTTAGVITGSTYLVNPVSYLDPTLSATMTLDPAQNWYFRCPSSGTLYGIYAPQSNVNFYISNTYDGWWQTQNGLIYGGNKSGATVVSQIPLGATCSSPNCIPAMSIKDAAGTAGSTGFAITGGGTLSSSKAPGQQYSQLSQDNRLDHVVGGTIAGAKENYAYFYELYSMGTSPSLDWASGGAMTKPAGAPANGKPAYYATGNMSINSPWTVNAGESFVIFIHGTLTVNANITVAQGGFLAFIADDNITFANTLTSSGVPTATNLAVGKTASQWATYAGLAQAAAAHAIDGNTDGNWADNSLSIADTTTNPWWQVDLGASYNISSVNVYGRSDCCGTTQSNNFHVFVSDNPFASGTLIGTQTQVGVSDYPVPGTAGNPTPSTVSVNRSGRYVRIQKDDTGYLSLGEVQVMGTSSGTSVLSLGSAVAGLFVSDKQIIVAGGLAGGDLPFAAEGTYVGWGGVQLNRQYANKNQNNSNSTEIFRFRPDLVFNVPNMMTKPKTIWQETN